MKKLLLSVFILFAYINVTAQENTFTYKLGDFKVTTLSESKQNGNTSILIDAPEDVLKKYAPAGTFPNAVNAFLIQTPNKNILVDAGFGRNLFDNLKQLNVTPDKIDVILLTHMHGDHIGGLLKDGKVCFSNAELYVSQAEYDYWIKANSPSQKKVFEAYKDKLHLFEPTESGIEVIPSVKAIATYGHTPGHTSFLVTASNNSLLIWGDITHALAIQIPHPEISVTYDVDPVMAKQSRVRILEYINKNNIPVAGMHIPFPSFL